MADLETIPLKGIELLDDTGILKESLPSVMKSISEIGGRSQTNYMDRVLNINEQPTRLGQARQLVAEIASIKSAIEGNPEAGLDNVYVRGAIKRLIGFCQQYRHICQELGVDFITDEMIETGQHEYHLKCCFLFALRSAASSGGFPDDGDYKYANAIGLSVSELAMEVRYFLYHEENGKMKLFSLDDQRRWLDGMWIKYGEAYE